MMIVIVVSLIGFFLSLYGFYVEQQIKMNPNYKPLCDISDQISCSKPILSAYGKIFKVPNTVVGMLFYAGMILLAWSGSAVALWYGALVAASMSVIFAYILFFRIQSLCLLCVGIYLVNFVLFYVVHTMA